MSLTNIDGQQIPNPNIYTAVGALCLDATIRRELFHSQTPGIQDVLLDLDENEFQTCMNLTSNSPSNPPEEDYAAVGLLYCRKQPCPHAVPDIETVLGAAIIDESFRAAWFNDPHQAHLDYGCDLTDEEDAMLVDILNRKGEEIQQKVEILGRKLKKVINVKPLATVSQPLKIRKIA
jgi:hypothetical protein